MALSRADLDEFRRSISEYLDDRYGDLQRRAIYDSADGWSAEIWKEFAGGLGLLGAGFAEADGGLGGGVQAHAMILEQFGAHLVLEPYLQTAVIGGAFLTRGTHRDARALLEQLIAGELITAYAHNEPQGRYAPSHVATRAERRGDGYVLNGSKAIVIGAACATHLIVIARSAGAERAAHGLSAFLVPAASPGIERRDYRTVSGMTASDIVLRDVAVSADGLLAEEAAALPMIEAILDDAALMTCAEGLGVMRRLHADTVAYTSERKQFGKPLASFQVLQHRMADMIVLATQAAAITAHAVETREDAGERAKIVSAAKVTLGRAIRYAGQQAVQLHGGMGMTDELAVSFFFKRGFEIERQFGDTDYHLARYERLAFADGGVR